MVTPLRRHDENLAPANMGTVMWLLLAFAIAFVGLTIYGFMIAAQV